MGSNGTGKDRPVRIGTLRCRGKGHYRPLFPYRVASLDDQLDATIECGGCDLSQLLQQIIRVTRPPRSKPLVQVGTGPKSETQSQKAPAFAVSVW